MRRATFQGKVEKLELARGHDGFLRGGPDPVLLLGVYGVFGSTVRLLGRSLHRFASRTKFPTEIAPDAPAIPAFAIEAEGFHFLVLAVALEEDGGRDVQRLFGAFEHVALLSVWSPERSEVDPIALAAFPVDVEHTVPTTVEMVIDGEQASSSCKSDKWIGAVCWSLLPRAPAGLATYRLPFLAPDRRNDWTAVLNVEH